MDVTLNDVGLYFYYFDLYTDFRRIVRGPDNCGVVSWQEGESWQITVYEADFETPAPIKGKVFYQIFPDRFCGVNNHALPDQLYQADNTPSLPGNPGGRPPWPRLFRRRPQGIGCCPTSAR